jgi:energy-coupling factor transport system ATP-binding protein
MLLEQISAYHRARGSTVILVSHSMEDIARFADRVLVMNEGRAVMLDKTKNVFARGRELEAMGLRVPQITSVLLALREKGYPVRPVLTVDEAVEELRPLLRKGGAHHAQ